MTQHVTAVRQGYDLYNHIHVCGISQFTPANRAIQLYALAQHGTVSKWHCM